MNRSGKLHALLATARVANIPSVVSNVWLGVAVGAMINLIDDDDITNIPWRDTCRLMLAGVSLYVAGNFLNDWMDRKWDEQHRAERALPRGLFKPRKYLIAAVMLGTAGVALAASVHWLSASVAALIVVSIVIYTVWHKRAAWAVIPMGLCRALLPIMGAVGMVAMPVNSSVLLSTVLLAGTGACGLFCYIVGLSMSARYESMESPSRDARNLPRMLFTLTVFLMLAPSLLSGRLSWLHFIAPVPYIAWFGVCQTKYRRPISKRVSSLLAGIPLVDWIFLLPASLWTLTLNTPRLSLDDPLSVGCFAIPPLAFVSALLLQRLAPAT